MVSGTSRHSLAGVIAGCTIGALVVTTLAMFLLWRWSQKKRRRASDKLHIAETAHHPTIVPYASGQTGHDQDETVGSPSDSTLAPHSPSSSGGLSKAAREFARGNGTQPGESASNTGYPLVREPPGSEQGTIASMAMAEVQGLRAELEGLRSMLRGRHGEVADSDLDAPPDYTSHV